MDHGAQHPAPVMDTGAGFQSDFGPRQFGKEGFNLPARRSSRRRTAQSCLSMPCSVKICFDVSIDMRLYSMERLFHDGL
jgi:hypothetical protein